MALTILYGFTNSHALNTKLIERQGSKIDKHFGRPLSFCFEYALKDNFTVGVGMHYFKYDVKEENTIDSSMYRMKGQQIGLSARVLRFILHRPRTMTYLFMNAGVRFRQQTFSSETNGPFLNSCFPGSQLDEAMFKPYSLEAGLGAKFLITRRIGLGAEVGLLNAIVQTGLTYIFLEPSRKTKDAIGW